MAFLSQDESKNDGVFRSKEINLSLLLCVCPKLIRVPCSQYECLVEGCSARFLSDPSRHQHLVDKHHFPRSFRFHVKKHPSQKQRQRQKAQTQPSNSGTTQKQPKKNPKAKASHPTSEIPGASKPSEPTTPLESQMAQIVECSDDTQMDVDELVTGISRLSTVSQGGDDVPSVPSFGHRRGRAVPFGQKTRGSGRGRGRSRGRGSEPPSPAQPSPQ